MAVQILLRYGELALKSPPVRREFEHRLRRNILEQFVAAGVSCRLRADHGHFYVEAEREEPATSLLRRVFGVTSLSQVVEVETERVKIREAALQLVDPKLSPGSTFAVRARRTGQHAFTSQELARDLGGDILERWPDRALKVDLDSPQVELFVEVRGPRTYLYTDRSRGPGGLPLGVAGQVVALVDGRRGALGAFLMMKRGCRCAVVATGDGAGLVQETLKRFDPGARIEVSAAESADGTLESLLTATRADGIVLPLGMDDYPSARERWGDRVVFSPTVGLTDEEVDDRWRAIVQLAA
ncbi:MAG TPA: THUMP domain-containing protein [Thermoplasmata archaeon]|nr:THUMP domain-containing protein [Thermoplasmata archaeon]